MKKQRRSWLVRLRTAGLLAASGAAAAGLLSARLASLVPRLTATEAAALHDSAYLHAILDKPLYLPLKLLQSAAALAPSGYEVLAGRLPSVLLGLAAFFAFLYLSRRWYGRRGMVFGCLIFATSAWFLHVSRFAGIDILYVAGLLALLAIHVKLYDNDDRPAVFYGWLLTNLALLFIPGFVWFVLLSLVWQWRVIGIAWRNLGSARNRALWSTAAVTGIGAIAFCLVRAPGLVRQWLGVPQHFLPPLATLRHIAEAYGFFVYRGPHDPQLWLGRLPILDAFLVAMLVMGAAFYARHWRAARTRLLGSYVLLGGILVGLQGGVRLSIMMPTLYLVIVGGIVYALHFWNRTFPRNQLARSIGLLGIVILVSLSCVYNLRQYFIAWPHNPETLELAPRRS